MEYLNNLINKFDIMNVYRTLYPTIRDYTFFSNTQGTYIKICHVLCPKTNYSRIQGNLYLQNLLSYYTESKLEINNKKTIF